MIENTKIILCPNTGRDRGFEITRKVAAILEKFGRTAAFCPVYDDNTFVDIPKWFKPEKLEDVLPFAEMVITFGGDGTILRAARAAARFSSIPILGVNMGGKGFMAELETGEIEHVKRAVCGDYGVEYRMMLDITLIRSGEVCYSDFALNDVVISGVNKVIDLTLFGDGQKISHFSGDGAVVATPTGSTAYSMAAGGPIVEPSAQNIIVTPICAHVLEAKPFVLVSDRCVTVEIGIKKISPAFLSVDGCDYVPIYSGDTVTVKKSDKQCKLVQLTNRSFYERVSEKLGMI